MTEFERLRARLPSFVTRGDMEKVLRAVLSDQEPWQWFGRARVPFPAAVAILRALRDGGYLAFAAGGDARFTPPGESLLREVGAQPAPNFECEACAGSGMDWHRAGGPSGLDLAETYARYLEVFNSRPRSEDKGLDQGAMTPGSLFRRLALMIQQGDIAGKHVAALGDDDLAGIALALTGLPRQVTVLEIDARICDFIGAAADSRGLSLRVLEQDLASRLPAEILGTCDTFVCDPPETEAGLALFVEKGLALLRPGDGHAGYFGATVLEASPAKWRRWQTRLLQQHEIAFTHILPPFTEYEPWPDEQPLPDLPPLARLSPRPWYRFAFYRLETLPAFRPARDFEAERSEIFYFDAESYYEAYGPAPPSLPRQKEKRDRDDDVDDQ